MKHKQNMEETKNPIEVILETALMKLKDNVAAESVVGEPFTVGEKTIVPLSKVSVGFVAGGGEYLGDRKKVNYPMSGGSGGGYSVAPIGFLVVDGKDIKLITVNEKSLYVKLLELIPKTAGQVVQGLASSKQGS